MRRRRLLALGGAVAATACLPVQSAPPASPSKEAAARPLFIAIDHEGGSVIRVGRGLTVLPGAMALAATPDPVASVERASAIAASELRAAGVGAGMSSL